MTGKQEKVQKVTMAGDTTLKFLHQPAMTSWSLMLSVRAKLLVYRQKVTTYWLWGFAVKLKKKLFLTFVSLFNNEPIAVEIANIGFSKNTLAV